MRRTIPPSRTRRIAKWTGLGVCVVILAISVVLAGVFALYGPYSGPIDWLHISLVLMFPVVVAAIPTAILWHRDRRTVMPGRNLAMRPPFRFRRMAKWIGLVVCVMILAIWHTSVFRPTMLYSPFGCVSWSYGVLAFYGVAASDYPYLEAYPLNLAGPGPLSWHETLGFSVFPESVRIFGMVSVIVPLWMPFLVAAVTTTILWRRDRRTPGCCRVCGYDLRASKKTCPECGNAIAPEPR